MGFDDRYRVSAHAVVSDADGRVLLLRAAYLPNRWSLPGGNADPGESVAEAVVRECREELGTDIALGRFVGLYFHQEFDAHVAVFRASLTDPSRITLSGEHSATAWVEPDELPQYTTSYGTARMLGDALTDDLAPQFRSLVPPMPTHPE